MGPKKSHVSAGYMIHLVCPYCLKEFNGNSSTSGVRSNYRRHLLIHTGERPFPCPYCRNCFTTKSNMRRHIAALHASHLTPTSQAHAELNDAEPVAPPPPLRLPTSTTTNTTVTASPVASLVSSSGHEKPGSTAATVESIGLTSSAGSQTVSECGSEGAQQRLQQTTTATFICEDCELEVSSRAKLRRHQRYYCPFRDNIFADPVQDALSRYRAEQQRQAIREEEEEEDGSECSNDSNLVYSDGDVQLGRSGHIRNATPRHRRRRHSERGGTSSALTAEERNYLARVAAQSGLRFVEDAYTSESGSNDYEGVSGSCNISCTSSQSDEDTDIDGRAATSAEIVGCGDRSSYAENRIPPLRVNERRTAAFALTSPSLKTMLLLPADHVSPKRNPLHGPFPPPNTRVLQRLTSLTTQQGKDRGATVAKVEVPADVVKSSGGGAVDGCEGEEDEVNPEEDLLHLHYHRRGSGHRRERRILQKRLRGQEGVLLGLNNSPLRRPQKCPRADPAGISLGAPWADGPTCAASSSNFVMAPSSCGQPPAQRANAVSIVLSEQLLARADSLLTLNWRHSHRSKASVSSEFVCPYCNDFNVFSNQRRLAAHMRRMHPAEVARNVARVNAREVASADGSLATAAISTAAAAPVNAPAVDSTKARE